MSSKRNNHQSRQQQNVVQASMQASVWSSPLPPPDVISKYKEIEPRIADIVIEQIQKEANHRRECEKIVLYNHELEIKGQIDVAKAQINENRIKLFLGFILALTVLSASVYFVVLGKDLYAVASIASIIAFIFWGKSHK